MSLESGLGYPGSSKYDSSHHTTDVDDEPETKPRSKNSVLNNLRRNINPYNEFNDNI